MSTESIQSELLQFQLGNEGPKYEQLRKFIAAQMDAGTIQAGDALPPEKQMAELVSLSRVTVRQALAKLEKDGYIR
ncbi:MAG: GntR family transcriptional regulator, partial [Planctomycetia bacterium]